LKGNSSVGTRYEDIQDWLVRYLAGVLDMEPDDIGVTTPFSRFGLDSAATIILTGDLIEWLGCQIESDTVYQYPTVRSLARFLAESRFGERVVGE
jgi:acyl carrier protein